MTFKESSKIKYESSNNTASSISTHTKIGRQSNDIRLVDAFDVCQSTVEMAHVIVVDSFTNKIRSFVFKSLVSFNVAASFFSAV